MNKDLVVEAQPLPTEGKIVVQDMLHIAAFRLSRYAPIVDDIKARGEIGKQKYGTYLMTHNGRDADIDLYQELCDAIAYNTQGVLEEKDEEELKLRVEDTDRLFAVAWRCRQRLIRRKVLDGR